MKFKKNKEGRTYPLKDILAKRIACLLLSVQSRFAVVMGTKANTLSIRVKWLWLVVFCLLFGGFSIYSFVGAFRNKAKAIKPSHISMPKYYHQPEAQTESAIGKRDIVRINRFKKYIDSLQQSQDGKIICDSILKARPGLMDSIRAIEQIYFSQSK
jgi:hypothetical protein